MIDAAAEDRRPRLQARHAGGRQRLPPVRQQPNGGKPRDRRADAARRDAVHPDGPGHEALDSGAARREPVHPVRLLLRRRHVELPAPARPRGLRLPHDADVPGHPNDGDRHAVVRQRAAGVNAVYAFNTDSARGLALAIDLLDKGVNVYRSTAGFTAGGKTFYSGAALVDGTSLATSGVNLARGRQAPDAGHRPQQLPAPRKQLTKPKIGLYTGAATIPSNPLFPEGPNVNGTSRHCALSGRHLVLRGAALAGRQARGSALDADPGHVDRPGRQQAGHRRVHRVHQPGLDDRHHDRHRRTTITPTGEALRRSSTAAATTSAPTPAAPPRPARSGPRRSTPRRSRACSRRARRSTARSTQPTRWPGASTSAAGSTVTPPATRCSTARPRGPARRS